MRHSIVLSVAVLLCFTGCEQLLKQEPPRSATEKQQTKEEILSEIRPFVVPIQTTLAGGAIISDVERYTMLSNLRDAMVRHGETAAGRAAFQELSWEVQGMAKQAADMERYRLVLICIDVAELLDTESLLLKRLGAKANVMLDMPTVRVNGFIDDIEKKQTYIFIELFNRRTGEVEKLQAREGEEFNNLRLVRILGANKAVLFEYLKLPGLFFEVESF
ncbi:MAG: hypothetical protein BWY09_00281 [Candidatus Hydrogenedentes bacterium ADurb.Bin179]|nr:MAG: hypothetical protein BWY09_00281 [Candidatus Hydrogenedentes bacterium ADurb.Bin179]